VTVFANNDDVPAVTALPSNPGHVDVVHARVRDAILRGDMKPGEEVRQERVSRELNVSRTPLREALRMLEREGLVQSSANRSYRVTGFSLADMEQIYVARLPLEAMAIRLSIPRMDTQDLAALEGCMAQMDTFAKAKDYEHWEVPHRAFHAGLVVKGGARVARLVGELSDHAERYRRFRTVEGPRAWSKGFHDHRSILEACAAGDAAEGARRLARHLFHTAEDVIRMIDAEYDPADLRTALAVAEAPVAEVKA
jgi:DNA-binding GntR family transcriptional regulator